MQKTSWNMQGGKLLYCTVQYSTEQLLNFKLEAAKGHDRLSKVEAEWEKIGLLRLSEFGTVMR